MARSFILLDHRGLLRIDGADRRSFLQGLTSNDVAKVSMGRAVYSAVLTPQGKFLHDFCLAEMGESLWLDPEAARAEDLRKRLTLYKLRSKVSLALVEDWRVVVLVGEGAAEALDLPAGDAGAARLWGSGVAFVDPRLPGLGVRAFLPAAEAGDLPRGLGFIPAGPETWEALRLGLGVPEGSRDLIPEKGILLENGFDELRGVDWQKGCYMGQELTARTRYRGLVRKRLLPVSIDGAAPEPGTVVMLGDREAGEMRSSLGGKGLAMIRLEMLENAESGGPLRCGDATLTVAKPDWVVLPAAQG